MNKITVFLLVFIIPFNALGQNYLYEYEYSFLKDSLSENISKEKYFLSKDNDNYIFAGEYYYYLDSLENNDIFITSLSSKEIRQIRDNSSKIGKSTLKTVLQKPNNQLTFYKNFFNKIRIKYSEEMTLNWDISNDKFNYLGYSVQSAYTEYGGRKYTAWFTTDIPISSGPYVFNNLPGLILKIEDENKQHSFELVALHQGNKKMNLDIYQNVSKKEFIDTEDKVKNNPISMLLPNNQISAEMKQKLKERIAEKNKHDNNPIELTFK